LRFLIIFLRFLIIFLRFLIIFLRAFFKSASIQPIQKQMAKQAQSFLNSNLANFGTEIEYNVKKTSALSETEWRKTRDRREKYCWRVENFNVVEKDPSVKLHTGDSYIFLHKLGNQCYDLYFWLGSRSTMDERCVAAYKTVELDTYLNLAPTQYRELQFKESEKFKQAFGIPEYLPGGVKSGFVRVGVDTNHEMFYSTWTPIIYSARNKEISENPVEYLDDSDVVIVDNGLIIDVHYGNSCSNFTCANAMFYIEQLKKYRPEVTIKQHGAF
jgi:gelsolin